MVGVVQQGLIMLITPIRAVMAAPVPEAAVLEPVQLVLLVMVELVGLVVVVAVRRRKALLPQEVASVGLVVVVAVLLEVLLRLFLLVMAVLGEVEGALHVMLAVLLPVQVALDSLFFTGRKVTRRHHEIRMD